MPRKFKIKLYMTVIRPVLLYGAECWTVRKKEEQILEKTEMRMLRRIKGVTLRDRVKSVDIRKEHESARKKAKGETKGEMDGWRPKGYAGTADHPGGCTGQNILEIKNSGR